MSAPATIAGMLAARWDTAAELGGGWRRTVRRRTTTGTGRVDLAMIGPSAVRVWGRGGATDERGVEQAPKVERAGLISSDHKEAVFALTAGDVRALGVGEWEIAITVTDPDSGDPVVLSRGYIRVTGSVELEW